MEVFYNASFIFISLRRTNSSVSHGPTNNATRVQTFYEECEDMPAALIFYLVLKSINMFLGMPANILVLWLLHKNKWDSSTSDIFILHQAILDVFLCLTPPLELANILYLTTSSPWYVLRFLYGLMESSPLFIFCICLDRYMAVLHPVTFFNKLRDPRYRAIHVAAVWSVMLAYAAARCAGNIVHYDKVFLILPAFALSQSCNIAILWALRQSGPDQEQRRPEKKRAFKLVLMIFGINTFNYLPPVVLLPLRQHLSEDVFKCYIVNIAFQLSAIHFVPCGT